MKDTNKEDKKTPKIGDKVAAVKKPKKKKQYVDNKLFLAAMVVYKEGINDWKAANGDKESRPRVPDFIGECIMKIATHLSHRPNFINYTFREEMICDGIENCLQYIDNFDVAKSRNPFAYFTQIIYFAFLRRIAKEKKLLYTKIKLTENANIFDMTSDRQESDVGSRYNDDIKYGEWTKEYVADFTEQFEEKKRREVRKRTRVGIDKFIGRESA